MQQPASPYDFSGGSYAEYYQSLLVPRLFAPWARRLLDAVEFRSGDRLLDVACGPGTVTREGVARGGKGVTGIDSSPAMLEIARVLDERKTVVYTEASADALPVADESYNVVTCQQGLQFFDRRNQALREMHRVLVRRGRVAIAVWARIEQQPFWHALFRGLERAISPAAAAGVLKPFSFPGANELRDEVVEAGFISVSVFTDELPIVFEGGVTQAAHVPYAIPSGNDLEKLDDDAKKRLRDATIEELREFEEGGIVESSCRAHVAIARR